MDSNIYYMPAYQGLIITSEFAEIQKRMDIGMDPKIEYVEIDISELNKYTFNTVGFKKIDNDYFQSIKYFFSIYHFEAVAFHHTTVDLSDVVIDVKHLLIGDNSKINLSEKNFKNLEEITFLSVKTFKGKILKRFDGVNKLILWYENNKSNAILENFPNLKEFYIYNGSLVQLDLIKNPKLERLQLHRCLKLEKVVLLPSASLRTVIVESCNRLDISNLGNNLTRQ